MKQMQLQFLAVAQALFLTNMFGIYIHIPFCVQKCAYCNFYSVATTELLKEYIDKTVDEVNKWGGQIARPVSSVYIGGGTPSIMSGAQLGRLMDAIRKNFNVTDGAEITVEVNPGDKLETLLADFRKTGCNRLSIGVQSGNPDELKILGRRHTVLDAEKALAVARNSGFDNISLDLMTALPNSSENSLKKSLEFILSMKPEHISTYMLKLEQGTPLYKIKEQLILPDEDMSVKQYLLTHEILEKSGYNHYEISNFAKLGYEGRHNSNYWQCGEYLGIGPAAHSFLDGKRFYYTDDLKSYLQNPAIVPDGEGGGMDEYIMLGLRLKKGISGREFYERFSTDMPKEIFEKAKFYQKHGLCRVTDQTISLTVNGMLVSNGIISSFIKELF